MAAQTCQGCGHIYSTKFTNATDPPTSAKVVHAQSEERLTWAQARPVFIAFFLILFVAPAAYFAWRYSQSLPPVGFNGVANPIMAHLNESLHDAQSFELVKAGKIERTHKDGVWAQTVTFRAKNGFGALVLGEVYLAFDRSEVVPFPTKPSAEVPTPIAQSKPPLPPKPNYKLGKDEPAARGQAIGAAAELARERAAKKAARDAAQKRRDTAELMRRTGKKPVSREIAANEVWD